MLRRAICHVADFSKAFAVSEVRSEATSPSWPGRDLSRVSGRCAAAPARAIGARVRVPAADGGWPRSRRLRRPRRRWWIRVRRSRSTRARPRTTSRSSCVTRKGARCRHNGLLIAAALAEAPGIPFWSLAGCFAFTRCRSSATAGGAAYHQDQRGVPRRPWYRHRRGPDGSEPRGGPDQAGNGDRLRAGHRDRRRHEVAPDGASPVRSDRPGGRDRDRHWTPSEEVEAWRARDVEIVAPSRPKALTRRHHPGCAA